MVIQVILRATVPRVAVVAAAVVVVVAAAAAEEASPR